MKVVVSPLCSSKTKVAELDCRRATRLPRAQHDIGRLQIPVHNHRLASVQECKRICNLHIAFWQRCRLATIIYMCVRMYSNMVGAQYIPKLPLGKAS